MKDYLIENSTAIAAGGVKATVTGATTAVVFGVALNQAEIQLIGVICGVIVGLLGLTITAVGEYYKHKQRERQMIWDGSERRKHDRNPDKSIS